MKKRIADYALSLIKDGMTIGLGGGSTVALIAEGLSKSTCSEVQIFSLVEDTLEICRKNGLSTVNLDSINLLDWTFDGCDFADSKFQALKTMGGIQTQEKITANLSKRYCLLVTADKFQQNLSFELPICCEVLPEAMPVINHFIHENKVQGKLRKKQNGYELTKYGNYLLDLTWHKNAKPKEIARVLNELTGIVSHSLFLNEPTDIIIGTKEKVELITKKG